MDEIIRILMNRDRISREEAEEVVEQCQDEIEEIIESGGTYIDAEDAIAYWLGLEPDYLDYFLF